MDYIKKKLFNFLPVLARNNFENSSERTRELIKNVGLSLAMKCATVFASFLLVPMTINYVNPTQYGIWLTLSSIITWIYFFDLGLGNGFRNRFAEAKAKGDILLARQLVSTTYFAIGMIVVPVCALALLANVYIDWAGILKVPTGYQEELQKIFAIVLTFTCMNMVANIFSSLLAADQKTGYAAVISAIGQYLSLLVIFILTHVSEGSLMNLALFYSGIPCLVMIAASVVMYKSYYKKYRPSFYLIKFRLIQDILKLGSHFFIIYICLIAIFQVINVVISREIGAVGVTQYNITNRYFGIMLMLLNMIVVPLWSSFTDAYARKDFSWMKSMALRMQKCWMISAGMGLLLLLLSPLFYRIWIGDSVEMPAAISIAMFFLVVCQSLGSIFMHMINGLGTIRIQMITYILFALLAWPLFTVSARMFGLVGIIAIPCTVYFVQGLLGKIQLGKIINQKATGIWLK